MTMTVLQHAWRRLRNPITAIALLALGLSACAAENGSSAVNPSSGSGTEVSPSGMVTVTPEPSDAVFANPGMGWQTFHASARQDPATAVAPSSVYYIRWYWDQIERSPGDINFRMIDNALAQARAAGQTLAFRVMVVGDGYGGPDWLRERGARGMVTESEGETVWSPDLGDPVFQQVTPFLLRRLEALTEGATLDANIALVLNNARVAAGIASALAGLTAPSPLPPRPAGRGRG